MIRLRARFGTKESQVQILSPRPAVGGFNEKPSPPVFFQEGPVSEPPLILVSNDDGIDSPYLEALASALERDTPADVLVIAPERQRSAMSHTITLHKPLRVVERAPGRVSASGSPVDCVYIGLMQVAPRRPALVISGINSGYNLGTDVFYSGTVAAAVEGGLRGVTSMAISLAPRGESSLVTAVKLSVCLANKLLTAPIAAGSVLNVNVPPDADGRYRWTKLGKRYYEDDVHCRKDPRGRSYYWIGGGVAGVEDVPGSDCEAVYAGIASITPLQLDLTAHRQLEEPLVGLEGFVLDS
jgi:5'-nucleotidase